MRLQVNALNCWLGSSGGAKSGVIATSEACSTTTADVCKVNIDPYVCP